MLKGPAWQTKLAPNYRGNISLDLATTLRKTLICESICGYNLRNTLLTHTALKIKVLCANMELPKDVDKDPAMLINLLHAKKGCANGVKALV